MENNFLITEKQKKNHIWKDSDLKLQDHSAKHCK